MTVFSSTNYFLKKKSTNAVLKKKHNLKKSFFEEKTYPDEDTRYEVFFLSCDLQKTLMSWQQNETTEKA